MKRGPVVMHSIFTDSWVDVHEDDGFARYFCTGVLQEPDGMDYYVMHSEGTERPVEQGNVRVIRRSIGNPYFIPRGSERKIRFVCPQPALPAPETLFDRDVPFWLEVKGKARVK